MHFPLNRCLSSPLRNNFSFGVLQPPRLLLCCCVRQRVLRCQCLRQVLQGSRERDLMHELSEWLRLQGAHGVNNVKCEEQPSGERRLVAVREFLKGETLFCLPLECAIYDWPGDDNGQAFPDGPSSVRLAVKLLRHFADAGLAVPGVEGLAGQPESTVAQAQPQPGPPQPPQPPHQQHPPHHAGELHSPPRSHDVNDGHDDDDDCGDAATLATPTGTHQRDRDRDLCAPEHNDSPPLPQPPRPPQRPGPPQQDSLNASWCGGKGVDWGPYLRTLPRRPPAMLLDFHDAADLAALEYLPLERALVSYRALVAQHYEYCGGAQGLGGASLEQFAWALAIVGSRCLGTSMLHMALLTAGGHASSHPSSTAAAAASDSSSASSASTSAASAEAGAAAVQVPPPSGPSPKPLVMMALLQMAGLSWMPSEVAAAAATYDSCSGSMRSDGEGGEGVCEEDVTHVKGSTGQQSIDGCQGSCRSRDTGSAAPDGPTVTAAGAAAAAVSAATATSSSARGYATKAAYGSSALRGIRMLDDGGGGDGDGDRCAALYSIRCGGSAAGSTAAIAGRAVTGGQLRMLVPWLDLINHGGVQHTNSLISDAGSKQLVSEANVRWELRPPSLDLDGGKFEQNNNAGVCGDGTGSGSSGWRSSSGGSGWRTAVVATTDLAAGTELLLCYDGTASNDSFALHYGFVQPLNPYDDVQLYDSLAEALAWHRAEALAGATDGTTRVEEPATGPSTPFVMPPHEEELTSWYDRAATAATIADVTTRTTTTSSTATAATASEVGMAVLAAPAKLGHRGRLCPRLKTAFGVLAQAQAQAQAPRSGTDALAAADVGGVLDGTAPQRRRSHWPDGGIRRHPVRNSDLDRLVAAVVARRCVQLLQARAPLLADLAVLLQNERRQQQQQQQQQRQPWKCALEPETDGIFRKEREGVHDGDGDGLRKGDTAGLWQFLLQHYAEELQGQGPDFQALAGLTQPAVQAALLALYEPMGQCAPPLLTRQRRLALEYRLSKKMILWDYVLAQSRL